MTCCGTPVHNKCIWNFLFETTDCCKVCNSELVREPDIYYLGEHEPEMDHWGVAMDRIEVRKSLGIPRWLLITLPNVRYLEKKHSQVMREIMAVPGSKIRPEIVL